MINAPELDARILGKGEYHMIQRREFLKKSALLAGVIRLCLQRAVSALTPARASCTNG